MREAQTYSLYFKNIEKTLNKTETIVGGGVVSHLRGGGNDPPKSGCKNITA